MIKFCPNCGKEANSNFCPFCGYDLTKIIIENNEAPAEEPAEDPFVISFESAAEDQAEEPKAENPAPEDPFSTYTAPAQDTGQNYNTYYIPPENKKEPLSHKTWFIILLLLLFWPLGLFFMWRAKKFSKAARIIITVIIGVMFIINIISTIALIAAVDDYDESYDYDYSYEYDDDYSDYDSDYSSILGDSAVDMAKSYLNSLYFSREGLIEQLEYEGFSNSEATSAVDSLIIDWNAQAAGCAENYLRTFPDWSRSELIDQLEYEGFSYSQAAYGADAAGL